MHRAISTLNKGSSQEDAADLAAGGGSPLSRRRRVRRRDRLLASGSVALLADTIHNFGDALTAVPIGIAFLAGRRPATRRYTYGYGRSEDIAGLFVLLP